MNGTGACRSTQRIPVQQKGGDANPRLLLGDQMAGDLIVIGSTTLCATGTPSFIIGVKRH